MIERYTPPEIGKIWTEENRFRIMMEVELLACEALSNAGVIPKAAAKRIRKNANLTVKGINKREQITRHDVVAFLGEISSYIGKDAQYLHLGLTSSDVLDTALGVQLKQSADVLLQDLKKLRQVARRQAKKYKNTLCMGRTHGIHAEPTTFGLKLAVFFSELTRAEELLKDARARIATGAVSGAVGTYAHLAPQVERYICKNLGLKAAPISTQVVPRDGIAVFLSNIAVVGGMLERMSTEIRHLQRTEVLEAEEPFHKGQTGSSAMPHKRNPVSSERISGMSRLLRGYALSAQENLALWHERDIGHSSVERVILPDSTTALSFMMRQMTRILDGLNVYPKNMQRNLEITRGLIFSETVLLSLMHKGLARQDAYKIVQRHAMPAWRGGATFQVRLSEDPEVQALLSPEELNACFDAKRHTAHVNTIFKRLGLS